MVVCMEGRHKPGMWLVVDYFPIGLGLNFPAHALQTIILSRSEFEWALQTIQRLPRNHTNIHLLGH